MKRPRIPAALWGVFVVNREGAAVWVWWYATRKAARAHAASNARILRRDPVRYVVSKFVPAAPIKSRRGR
jgi:hypothetical protein